MEIDGEQKLIHEISRLGVHMTVVVPGGRWRGSSDGAQKLRPGVYDLLVRDCIFTRISSVRVRTHLYYYPGISKLIGPKRWDLVHIDDEGYNLATFLVVRQSVKCGIPVVFTARKSMFQSFPLPFNCFEKYVYQSSDGAVAGNTDALNVLRKKGFTNAAACIQLGVDPNVFRRLDASDLRKEMGFEDEFVFGFAGQIAQRKGLDTLIKALALLPKKCALVIVGAGPDSSMFRSMARELCVSERIRWQTWVDHKQIARYMCAFDVFVLPSRTAKRWREDFGRVLIEAMACETPVVGSDSGEIPNVIGDAGLIFHEGDERELAGHLLRLMENTSSRKALGRRGRERVLERFTYERIATKTVEFYKQVHSKEC